MYRNRDINVFPRDSIEQHNKIKLMEMCKKSSCTVLSTERETQKNAAVRLSKQAIQGHKHACVLMNAACHIHYFICGSMPQMQHHSKQIHVCQIIFSDTL